MDEELLWHLERVTGLPKPALAKVLDEFAAWYTRPLSDWVRDRHATLQRRGLRNDEIFRRIAEEARSMRFAAGPLTQRQIRRIIYG